jgi:hypothetical protein
LFFYSTLFPPCEKHPAKSGAPARTGWLLAAPAVSGYIVTVAPAHGPPGLPAAVVG